MTVAVIVAGDHANVESDLATYRSHFGLPACTTTNGCFRKVNQNGGASPLPGTFTGWGIEMDNDLEMVSAVCPNCHLLLVEFNNTATDDSDFGTAVNTAVSLGANVISNSYGVAELASDPITATNSTVSKYFNHPGVLIVASTGDCGYPGGFCDPVTNQNSGKVEFPAASPTVLSVGGTTLTPTLDPGRGWIETVWNGSAGFSAGSGCSLYEPKPAWQTDTGCAHRTLADVSAVAGNVAVYTTAPGVAPGWIVFNGTSVAAPIVAGIYALTGHAAATPAHPYANPGQFFDITSGRNNATCDAGYLCIAGTSYDGPTGIGSPNGPLMQSPVQPSFVPENGGSPVLGLGTAWSCGTGNPMGTGDFNGDGRPDFWCHNPATQSTYVALSNSTGTSFTPANGGLAVLTGWSCGAGNPMGVGDFNGDGRADFWCHNPGAPATYIATANAGGTTFSPANGGLPVSGLSSWTCGAGNPVGAADFNGDGRSDFWCHKPSTTDIFIAFGNSTGTTFTGANSGATVLHGWSCGAPSQMGTGDFNGDGHADFWCHIPSSAQTYAVFSDQTGTSFSFPNGTGLVLASGWTCGAGNPMGVGDFNSDGRSDFWCNIPSTASTYIALAGASGTAFTGANGGSAVLQTWSCGTGNPTGVADFNADGRADLWCSNPAGAATYVALGR